MHEAPEPQRSVSEPRVCAVQADNAERVHAMLGGPGSVKTAAVLKGHGQPLRAVMPMNDMHRECASTSRYDVRRGMKQNKTQVRMKLLYQVYVTSLVCHKVHEGMLPYIFWRICVKRKGCCFLYFMYCRARKQVHAVA